MQPLDPTVRSSRPEFDVHLTENVPVAMLDGVRLATDVYPTSNLFMAGHRIRLDIASSNHPRFDVNPNTGEPIGRERRRVVADNTVFLERGRESWVVLPIFPLEPSHP